MINREKIRSWYESYTKDALRLNQPQFWLLFWGACIVVCIVYYLYNKYCEQHIGNLNKKWMGYIIDLCILFPLVLLRRLHIVALILFLALLIHW